MRRGPGTTAPPHLQRWDDPTPTTCRNKEAWDACLGWETPEAGGRTPGGPDPRHLGRPARRRTSGARSTRGEPKGAARKGVPSARMTATIGGLWIRKVGGDCRCRALFPRCLAVWWLH
ncbi:hypothetical protein GCM10010350_80790 [Streptomyces galilaeus]|nr:hypothetical protein GCM10010350_80790 [Streptomyces galilaeus]